MDHNSFEELLKIQRLTAGRIIEEQQVDNKIQLLQIIQGMIPSSGKIQKEAVILEALQEGMNEDELETLFENLKQDHLIKESEGYIILS